MTEVRIGYHSFNVSETTLVVVIFDSFECSCFIFLIALISSCINHSVARLVLESDNFGRIKIRGENTNRYLCLSKTGDLVTRVRIVSVCPLIQCNPTIITNMLGNKMFCWPMFVIITLQIMVQFC